MPSTEVPSLRSELKWSFLLHSCSFCCCWRGNKHLKLLCGPQQVPMASMEHPSPKLYKVGVRWCWPSCLAVKQNSQLFPASLLISWVCEVTVSMGSKWMLGKIFSVLWPWKLLIKVPPRCFHRLWAGYTHIWKSCPFPFLSLVPHCECCGWSADNNW